MSKRAAATAASAAVSQSYAVSDDEDFEDLDELNSDDEDGDVKPPKGILHGALRPPRHVTLSTVQLHCGWSLTSRLFISEAETRLKGYSDGPQGHSQP